MAILTTWAELADAGQGFRVNRLSPASTGDITLKLAQEIPVAGHRLAVTT